MNGTIIAQSFPELVYLIMREAPDKEYWFLNDLIIAIEDSDFDIRIHSGYDAMSPDWFEVLHGCMKRESGVNNSTNEGKSCIFTTLENSCTEPWRLTKRPQAEQTYASYRKEVRGGHSAARSGSNKSTRPPYIPPPAIKVAMDREPLHIIQPDDEDGDGTHYIYIFEKCVDYRTIDNVTHRENGLPAFFDFALQEMHFYRYGKLHRTNGPAIIAFEKADDEFYINDELIGSNSENKTRILELMRRANLRSQEIRLNNEEMQKIINPNKYHGFEYFYNDYTLAKALHGSCSTDDSEEDNDTTTL